MTSSIVATARMSPVDCQPVPCFLKILSRRLPCLLSFRNGITVTSSKSFCSIASVVPGVASDTMILANFVMPPSLTSVDSFQPC